MNSKLTHRESFKVVFPKFDKDLNDGCKLTIVGTCQFHFLSSNVIISVKWHR